MDGTNPAANSTMMKAQKPMVCTMAMGLNPIVISSVSVVQLAQISIAIGATTHPNSTVPSPINALLK